ncbi:MAG: EAL domain-containing protein [Nocardioidaceae bacterium]
MLPHRPGTVVVVVDDAPRGQSIVEALEPGSRAADTVLSGVLGMADAMGLRTIAEGIETPEQAAHLIRAGATLGQGWLYGRAEPASHWWPQLG